MDIFKSMWYFLKLKRYFNVSLEKYACTSKVGSMRDRKWFPNIGRNQMMWDLGMNPEEFDDDAGR